MARPIPLNLGENPASARSKRIRYGKALNVLKEVKDGLLVIYGRPGMTAIIEEDTGPVRSLIVANDRLFYISGNNFYEVTPSLSVAKKGALDTSAGVANMSFDGFYIAMVDGDGLYTYKLADSTFAKNTDANIPTSPTQIMFIDGFHYINEANTGRFHTHKDAFSPDGDWAGDFATAEYSGDFLRAMLRDSSFAYIIGSDTTEIWEPNPEGTFPLKPNVGAFMELGTAAAGSPIQFANGVHWLARDSKGGYIALRAEGLRPQRVSTTELETLWSTYPRVDDAFSMSWFISGHLLWLLTFPSANTTWVYDESVPKEFNRWTEFQRFGEFQNTDIGGIAAAFFSTTQFGDIIVMGDRNSGALLKVSHDDKDDDGVEMQSIVSSQEIVSITNEYIDHPEVEVYMETGVGEVGTDPQMRLQYSDDHGSTWITKGFSSIGDAGDRTKRIRFKGLGRSRHRYYEFLISDPVRKAWFSAIVRRDGVGDRKKENLQRALGGVLERG